MIFDALSEGLLICRSSVNGYNKLVLVKRIVKVRLVQPVLNEADKIEGAPLSARYRGRAMIFLTPRRGFRTNADSM
jgi:hypothetical protein